jgi:SAM-dependent methyltransferase
MGAQNIYDDPEFLAGYVTLDRQVHGLDGAAEWPELRDMVGDVGGRRVVDLGCGFGWFSRWAAAQHAASVLGFDVSAKMLERAVADSPATVEYQRVDLDELELDVTSCDVVFSSLALHYVRDLGRLVDTIAGAVAPGGSLVFSVEHPIYSAPTSQQFDTSERGDRVWPLDNYLVEGERVTSWFVDGVVKQHRTVATYVNAVIDAGFSIDRLVEFGATAAEAAADPARVDDRHRPWFLLLRATRAGA